MEIATTAPLPFSVHATLNSHIIRLLRHCGFPNVMTPEELGKGDRERFPEFWARLGPKG